MLKEIQKNDPGLTSLDGVLLHLNNGDLAALNAAAEKFRFRDRSELLRYALAVIAQADEPIVSIRKNGESTSLTPSKDLLKEEGS